MLSLLTSLAMICSCQKQDSAVEQQLVQRKTELDAREEALIEREKVAEAREKGLNEREKALAQNKKVTANAQAVPPDPQSPDVLRDAAQMKALMSDPSRLNSLRLEKDRLLVAPLRRNPASGTRLLNQKSPKTFGANFYRKKIKKVKAFAVGRRTPFQFASVLGTQGRSTL